MKYKLLVADMDGTLLNDDKQLSEKDIQTIKKLPDFGIQFAIATGRHDSMIKSYLKRLDLQVPVISCNGAMVREPFSDQVFLSETLPKEQSLNVIEYAGLGIAVANAEDALKEKADRVTNATNNEDAVSEAIERFLLN
jgi:HAD superfamily hydrolase (TIGR01484 family)